MGRVIKISKINQGNKTEKTRTSSLWLCISSTGMTVWVGTVKPRQDRRSRVWCGGIATRLLSSSLLAVGVKPMTVSRGSFRYPRLMMCWFSGCSNSQMAVHFVSLRNFCKNSRCPSSRACRVCHTHLATTCCEKSCKWVEQTQQDNRCYTIVNSKCKRLLL